MECYRRYFVGVHTIGQIIRAARIQKKWSLEVLGVASQTSGSTVKRAESDDPKVESKSLARICSALGISFDETDRRVILKTNGFDEERASRGVPVAGRIPGGAIVESIDISHVDGYEELPLPLDRFPDCVACRISGNSMSPKFNDGEFVVLQLISLDGVISGRDYYVELSASDVQGGTLKQVILLEKDRILLIPINGSEPHKPMEVRGDDIRLMRRAIGKYVSYTNDRFGA